MSDWSNTPPTVDGSYWTRGRLTALEIPATLADGFWYYIGNDWSEQGIAAKVQFGSRIPSNEELLAMHKQIAELKATCSDYETDEHGIRHTLGVALGYPQDEHGEVCAGNTTAARLAEEAARKIATLTEERNAAEQAWADVTRLRLDELDSEVA